MQFQSYPFEKLNALIKGVEVESKEERITLTIGEPQFKTPEIICEKLRDSVELLNKYPKSTGEDYLKEAMMGFIKRRFNIELESNQIIPTFGTREVLFNFPQFYLFDKKAPTIAHPNPFYQIYDFHLLKNSYNHYYKHLQESYKYNQY